MNKTLDKLPALVAEELEAANKAHPPFHSLHEGFAVLLEEFDETKGALLEVERCLTESIWGAVKSDSWQLCELRAVTLKQKAIQVAAEAIQVAAMAQKFVDSTAGWSK